MNNAANIIVRDLGANVFSYTIAELPGFEARIGADNWKDPASKYAVTLCGQGVYMTRHAGKAYAKKSADRHARAWLSEMWTRRAEFA